MAGYAEISVSADRAGEEVPGSKELSMFLPGLFWHLFYSKQSRITDVHTFPFVRDRTPAMSDPQKYTIGWICAITTKAIAARAFLDEEYDGPRQVA